MGGLTRLSMSQLAQRVGLNHGAYHGEAIDIPAVLEAGLRAADAHGWQPEWLAVPPDFRLLTLRRQRPGSRRRIYLSTGIHGDEPPTAGRPSIAEEDACPPAASGFAPA
jgi:hypothetical protein